jgi:drug/metabolite transporter (DMT)-like permease
MMSAALLQSKSLGKWVYGQPYVLLVLTTLFWGGNVVAGKLAVGEISPMVLTFLRWLISCVVLAIVARASIQREWRELLPAWPYIMVMAGIGFTAFNGLYYAAAYHTSAVNIALIQGSTPAFVLLGTVFLGARLRTLQVVGVLATIVGVVLIATQADLATLISLAFNRGDAWLLLASILYALYTLALRWKPRVSSLTLFAALSGAACISSLPLLVIEVAHGQMRLPNNLGWLILFYVVLFPSLLGQVFYIRGIELAGPGTAGSFYNFTPVFGAALSILILGEPLGYYHVAALALVLGGIFVAERGRR